MMKIVLFKLGVVILLSLLFSFSSKRQNEISQYIFFIMEKEDRDALYVIDFDCETFSTRNMLSSTINKKEDILKISKIIWNARPIDPIRIDTRVKAFVYYKNSQRIDSFCVSKFGEFALNGKCWQSYDLLNYIYKDNK